MFPKMKISMRFMCYKPFSFELNFYHHFYHLFSFN